MNSTLKVRHHAAIAPAAEGDLMVSCSIGPAHELVALWASADDIGAFISDTSPAPQARVSIQQATAATVVPLAELTIKYPYAQPLPGGRILVVGARARWRKSGADRNAVIFDREGRALVEETLGDGIQHAFTTPSGRVWAGYFDEGVYGNLGWGDNGTPAPMGSCGLARFSAKLRPEWRFPGDGAADVIDDCYALNVDGETAWTCYYSDFPIVRIQNDRVTTWSNEIHGANAMAVAETRVALFGGYQADRHRLAVGDLIDGRLGITGEYRVVLPDGGPLPDRTRVEGRGRELHFLTDQDWYRLTVTDIP